MADKSPAEQRQYSDDVREAQLRLHELNQALQTDGLQGEETRNAVRQFQQGHGIASDGIIGPQTLATMRKHLEIDSRLLDVRAVPGAARSVAFTPYGQMVVGTSNGDVITYDGDPPEAARTERVKGLYRLGLSPDGQRMAAACKDGSIHVFEPGGGAARFVLDDKLPVYWARFSQAGHVAACAGTNSVWLWDPDADKPIELSFDDPVFNLAWGAGDTLFLSSNDRLWATSIGQDNLAEIQAHRGMSGEGVLRWLEVSPSKRVLAVRRRHPTVELYAAPSLEWLHNIAGEGAADASCLAFSPDSNFLAIGRFDGRIDIARHSGRGFEIFVGWPAHTERVTDIAFHPDGTRLASGSVDSAVKTWRFDEALARLSIAVLDSDMDHDGEDAFNISRDVTAFSRVILARDLCPPLSIGLFGDWGTGKTFFIETLKKQIARDAKLARDADSEGNPCAWYGHVVQITFNAWHYVETNLWAALVTHLFDELGRYIDKDDPHTTRQRLMERLETARAALDDARSRQAHAQTRLEQAKRVADDAAERIATAREREAELHTSDLVQLVSRRFRKKLAKKHPELTRDRLAEKAVGTPEDQKKLESELAGVAELWRSQTSWLATWWRRLVLYAGSHKSLKTLIALVAIAGGFVAAGVGLQYWRDTDALWTGVAATAGSAVPAAKWLAGARRAVIQKLETARAWLDKMAEHSKKLDDELAKVQKSRIEAALQPLEAAQKTSRSELQQAEAANHGAEKAIEYAEDAVAAAERAWMEASTGRVLFRLLSDRAKSEDYRQHLGIISLIRRDLEALADCVGAAPETDEATGITPDKPVARIDRIVLYIDDLDRCPPERVVDVLQAVHLLLGIRLFVVVVAVDSRWLIRSLDNHYERLLESKSEDDAIRVSTPRNYLEKIFQIPYVIQRMDEQGFARLVRHQLPLEAESDGHGESAAQRDAVLAQENVPEQADEQAANSGSSAKSVGARGLRKGSKRVIEGYFGRFERAEAVALSHRQF